MESNGEGTTLKELSHQDALKMFEEQHALHSNRPNKKDKNIEEIYKTTVLPQKIKLYYQYLKEMSIATDLKIIFATVKVLIK